MSKLFCVAVFLASAAAGCKEKTADPPARPEATQPAPDPSPAARKAEQPKPPATADQGSGSGSAAGSAAKPQTVDSTIDRRTVNPAEDLKEYPTDSFAEKMRKKEARLKASQAAAAKKQQ
jgi:hypothetical protein